MSEFWLTPNGKIYYDGDAGVDVPNHESIVILECLSLLHDALSSGRVEMQRLAQSMEGMLEEPIVDRPALSEYVAQALDEMEQEGVLSPEETNDVINLCLKETGLPEWIVYTALGSDSYDTRAHAISEWGWIRVLSNNVQMKQITKSNLETIAEELYDEFDNFYTTTFMVEDENGWCEMTGAEIDSGKIPHRKVAI